ncbi:MAG: hypothetical protein U9N51_07660, partial [Bacteroidota bacterium]|nr:hypothetical protein [Bacteroidota bacterium]
YVVICFTHVMLIFSGIRESPPSISNCIFDVLNYNVLQHYFENPQDSLKYRAACFLIGNMSEKHAWVDFELQAENENPIVFNVLDYLKSAITFQ